MFASKDTLLTRPSGGYSIARSVRLRRSASGDFTRTPASTTNQKQWTWSAWIKRGVLIQTQTIFCGGGSTNDLTQLYFNSGDAIGFNQNIGGITSADLLTSSVYRDLSSWYHIVVAYDSTQATSSNRVKLYVNATQLTSFSSTTYPALNANSYINTNVLQSTGRISTSATQYFDGYITEVNLIDGQALTPSSFGETDSITGVWKPKAYSGTYGTNGFELNFSDNSASTATTIGKDYSGNGNNWTPNNISVTAGVTYDSMVDSPTVGSLSSNYAVLNPLAPSTYITLSSGNLKATGNTATNSGMSVASFGVSTGKIVWEETINTVSGNFPGIGATTVILSDGNGQNPAASNTLGVYYRANGDIYKNSSSLVGSYTALSATNVVRFELDADALTCAIYRNNTLVVTVTGLTAGTFYPSNVQYNGSISDINFGQRPFSNTPNTGFVALNTYNLPASTIKNGAGYMSSVLYTGDGNTNRSITGVGFQTDFNWTKSRSSASYSHQLSDSVRGFSKYLYSNATNSEGTDATNHIQSVNSDGYVINSGASFNASGVTYVAWNWKAGTTSASNTNGTITSTVSVGATQGFSVVTWTGTASGATVGHGLGVAPKMIIIKNRSSVANWAVWHTSYGGSTNTDYQYLNDTMAKGGGGAANNWNGTAPTSSVFSVGDTAASNGSSALMVAYVFCAVAGYSAFGSYTGNGSTDGPFVYTGFRPRFVLGKASSGTNASTSNWFMMDSARNTYNVANLRLFANLSNADNTQDILDFTSNGFKLRTNNTSENTSGDTYIYMAFAENPFKNALAR